MIKFFRTPAAKKAGRAFERVVNFIGSGLTIGGAVYTLTSQTRHQSGSSQANPDENRHEAKTSFQPGQ